jgi:outer membrane scaffolding protein for murein synthesis (MipA/OmpV family)
MSMKIAASIALAAGVLACFAPAARAQSEEASADPGWSVGAELDLNSRYLWRSLVWNDKRVAQPSVWIGRSGWTISAWSNFVLGDEPNRRQFNEVDLRLSYETALGPFVIQPAVNIYSYPNQDRIENPTTGEFEIQVSTSLGKFSLETGHFIDFLENGGGYVGEVGLAYEDEPSEGLILDAAARVTFANARFNEFYIPYERGAIGALVLELGLTARLTDSVSVRPHLEWNRILDAGVRAALSVSPWIAAPRASVINFGVAVDFEH